MAFGDREPDRRRCLIRLSFPFPLDSKFFLINFDAQFGEDEILHNDSASFCSIFQRLEYRDQCHFLIWPLAQPFFRSPLVNPSRFTSRQDAVSEIPLL